MTFPGFTAETSLFPIASRHRSHLRKQIGEQGITPQLENDRLGDNNPFEGGGDDGGDDGPDAPGPSSQDGDPPSDEGDGPSLPTTSGDDTKPRCWATCYLAYSGSNIECDSVPCNFWQWVWGCEDRQLCRQDASDQSARCLAKCDK